jgi:class 3 adenylate cyclase
MAGLPEGTLTFLLTDVVGSTQAWEKRPEAMKTALEQHDRVLYSCVDSHRGKLVEAGREGDSILAVFTSAADAAASALAMQQRLAAEEWPEGVQVRVRIALHSGEAELRAGHYYGQALNRCARLLAAAHGGQILAGGATASLKIKASDALSTLKRNPSSKRRKISTSKLGEHTLHFTAVDACGNKRTKSFTYRVIAAARKHAVVHHRPRFTG